MLRRELLVEVEHDHIVVRVTGTSYAVSYYRMASSTGLVARNLPLRDDHRAPMSRLEFIKSSWELLKPKRKSFIGSPKGADRSRHAGCRLAKPALKVGLLVNGGRR